MGDVIKAIGFSFLGFTLASPIAMLVLAVFGITNREDWLASWWVFGVILALSAGVIRVLIPVRYPPHSATNRHHSENL